MSPQEIIDNIERTYKSTDLIYEMMLAYFVNLSGIEFRSVTLKKGSPIIRARYSATNESFYNLSDVSYPPKSCVKSFSRLNRPYQNLFYSSESEIACLAEMLPFWFYEFKTDDFILVTLSKWIVRSDLKLLIIPDTKNLSNLNRAAINQLNPNEIMFWDYISNKFRTSTIDDVNIYEFTSAFANALWLNAKEQNIKANGFIYSNVQSRQHINLALTTDAIDSGYLNPSEFVEVMFHRTGKAESRLPTYKEVELRKKGLLDIDKSKIEWLK